MAVGRRLARGEERHAGAVVVDHAASRAENSAVSGEWWWGDRKAASGALARCSTPPRCGPRQCGRDSAVAVENAVTAIQVWVREWMRAKR
jgi:hypothetical protein